MRTMAKAERRMFDFRPGLGMSADATASVRHKALRYFELVDSSAASVGPGAFGGNRLGPERRNTFFGSVSASIIRPMKQLLISSQFWRPQRISLVGSGLNGLLGELSKWEIAITRVPLGSTTGWAKLYPSCQLKSHFAL